MTVPAAPAIAKSQARNTSHQIEFGWPRVTDADREEPYSLLRQPHKLGVNHLSVCLMTRGLVTSIGPGQFAAVR